MKSTIIKFREIQEKNTHICQNFESHKMLFFQQNNLSLHLIKYKKGKNPEKKLGTLVSCPRKNRLKLGWFKPGSKSLEHSSCNVW